jgi:hypothetical protein
MVPLDQKVSIFEPFLPESLYEKLLEYKSIFEFNSDVKINPNKVVSSINGKRKSDEEEVIKKNKQKKQPKKEEKEIDRNQTKISFGKK